jgi:hypothetical protein
MIIVDRVVTRNSRRELLQRIARFGGRVSLANLGILPPPATFYNEIGNPALVPVSASPSLRDDPLLEELARANFRFFWEQANPETGLVRDRCNVRKPNNSELANIAATGFGLTALCIGEKREFITLLESQEGVLNSLRFLWKKVPHHRGFFYHWANLNTGQRIWDSEVSSVVRLFCFAESSPAASISPTRRFMNWHPKSTTGWTGTGFRKTRPYCRMDGPQRAGFCNTAGMTTAK